MIQLAYAYTCDVCSEKHIEAYDVPPSKHWAAPWPSLPKGWRLVDYSLICEKHTVGRTIVVDDSPWSTTCDVRWDTTLSPVL